MLVSRYSDWICDSCQSISFARRTKCFQCGAEKPKNPRIALRSSKGDDIMEKRVLLVKGLSSNTDEGLLLDSFQVFGQVMLTAAAQSLHPLTPLASQHSLALRLRRSHPLFPPPLSLHR